MYRFVREGYSVRLRMVRTEYATTLDLIPPQIMMGVGVALYILPFFLRGFWIGALGVVLTTFTLFHLGLLRAETYSLSPPRGVIGLRKIFLMFADILPEDVRENILITLGDRGMQIIYGIAGVYAFMLLLGVGHPLLLLIPPLLLRLIYEFSDYPPLYERLEKEIQQAEEERLKEMMEQTGGEVE